MPFASSPLLSRALLADGKQFFNNFMPSQYQPDISRIKEEAPLPVLAIASTGNARICHTKIRFLSWMSLPLFHIISGISFGHYFISYCPILSMPLSRLVSRDI